MNLQDIYKGKKVFVTGHTGFKGSWLITWLHDLGAVVKGYSLPPENKSDLYYAVNGGELCESVFADIREKDKLKLEILGFAPDFIFHLAAQPLVRLSYEIPAQTFEVNAQGTANVLDALHQLESPCIAVMITTDKVYHNKETDYHYKEDDRLGGYDPYSASKACAELVIDSYRNSFFHPDRYGGHQKSVAVARAGNVIGGGDWAKDRIIPDIIRALSAGEPVVVRNPASIRPWQHVLEPLHGYLILGAHQAKDPVTFADAYNFGPFNDDFMTVGDLVEKAVEIWGGGKYVKGELKNQVHEAGLLKLDISKALNNLRWRPRLNTGEAITSTINWYHSFMVKKEDARSLIHYDIQRIIYQDEGVISVV